MRILYISQYFPPEAGATQTRAFENARYLAAWGHDVTVICEVPNHPAGIVMEGYGRFLNKKRVIQGVNVIYVPVFTSQNKNFLTRLAFYFSFTLSAVLGGSVLLKGKFDLVYATSPPLPAAGAGLCLSRILNTPLFFEVRDLWPDSAVALGELNNRFAVRMAAKLEAACYRTAQKVIAVTEGIRDALIFEKKVPLRKVELIPNGATIDSFKNEADIGRTIRLKSGLDNKFVVLYAGILGIAQGLETLIMAAESLKLKTDIHFLVVGAGPREAQLKSLASGLGLKNIDFLGEYPRKDMPGIYGAADAALVPLAKLKLFEHARPSKMFDAWACETPILLGIRGEAKKLLAECGGGLCYEPEDERDLAAKILAMEAMVPELRHRMGRDARKYIESRHSRRVYAKKLERILRSGR